MARVLLTVIFLLSLSSGLTQAATQEAECYGGQITGDTFPLEDGPQVVYQGSFRGLYFPYTTEHSEAVGWENFNKFGKIALGNSYKMGQCVYAGWNKCGDASFNTQLCYSYDPFTLANTSNGETCVSDSDLSPLGVTPRRGLTLYGISIDRSGAETTYCQIEFKTLAIGEEIPTTPPGTGSTKVIGLAPGDPDTDQTPDGPTIPFPISVFQTAVPFMPHFLLIGMTVLLATLGVRSVRRRKSA